MDAEEVYRDEFPVRGGDFANAGIAARRIKQLLKDMGLDPQTVRRAALASHAARRNVTTYAPAGPPAPGSGTLPL